MKLGAKTKYDIARTPNASSQPVTPKSPHEEIWIVIRERRPNLILRALGNVQSVDSEMIVAYLDYGRRKDVVSAMLSKLDQDSSNVRYDIFRDYAKKKKLLGTMPTWKPEDQEICGLILNIQPEDMAEMRAKADLKSQPARLSPADELRKQTKLDLFRRVQQSKGLSNHHPCYSQLLTMLSPSGSDPIFVRILVHDWRSDGRDAIVAKNQAGQWQIQFPHMFHDDQWADIEHLPGSRDWCRKVGITYEYFSERDPKEGVEEAFLDAVHS
jgi:hypothetical protein